MSFEKSQCVETAYQTHEVTRPRAGNRRTREMVGPHIPKTFPLIPRTPGLVVSLEIATETCPEFRRDHYGSSGCKCAFLGCLCRGPEHRHCRDLGLAPGGSPLGVRHPSAICFKLGHAGLGMLTRGSSFYHKAGLSSAQTPPCRVWKERRQICCLLFSELWLYPMGFTPLKAELRGNRRLNLERQFSSPGSPSMPAVHLGTLVTGGSPRRPDPANPFYLHLYTAVLLNSGNSAVSGDVLRCPRCYRHMVGGDPTVHRTTAPPQRRIPPQVSAVLRSGAQGRPWPGPQQLAYSSVTHIRML